MLKQLRENTPPILQLGILLIGVILFLVVGIIVWLVFPGQDGEDEENATSIPIGSEPSLEPSPDQTPTESTEALITATPTQVALLPTATATAINTTAPTHTSAATSTRPSVTPTTTATHTTTPSPTVTVPAVEPVACVLTRNEPDGFSIRIDPDENAEKVDPYGAVPNTRLEVLRGTVPEGDWWFVRLDRGVEGWAYLGPLTTGTLIEVLPSCDE